jgi:hypothetical protein
MLVTVPWVLLPDENRAVGIASTFEVYACMFQSVVGVLVDRSVSFVTALTRALHRCLTSWAEVRSPGYLHFYKDRKAAQDAILRNRDPSRSVDSSALVINLSKVNSFTIPDKKNKDANCVDLDLGHESIRMRYAAIYGVWLVVWLQLVVMVY